MEVKPKKTAMTNNAKKANNYQQLIGNAVPLKLRRGDWIKELIENDSPPDSEQDAVNVIDYLKEEMAYLNRYQSNAAICRLNLRVAVHFLDLGGYELLCYDSLKACLETEFPKAKSLSTLYREASAARLEVTLFGKGKIGRIKESVLRPLSKFGNDEKQIKKAWKMAMQTKSDSSEFPTAKMVADAARNLLSVETKEEKLRWSKQSASDIAKRISPKLAKMMGEYSGNIGENQIQEVLELIEEHLLDKFNG